MAVKGAVVHVDAAAGVLFARQDCRTVSAVLVVVLDSAVGKLRAHLALLARGSCVVLGHAAVAIVLAHFALLALASREILDLVTAPVAATIGRRISGLAHQVLLAFGYESRTIPGARSWRARQTRRHGTVCWQSMSFCYCFCQK